MFLLVWPIGSPVFYVVTAPLLHKQSWR